MICAFENAKMGFFTIGDIAIFEQSLAISSWIKDSMLALPKPKSFRFFSKNLLCSLQYCPPVPITPGFRPLLSFPTVCQPGLFSLFGSNGALADTSSRLNISVKKIMKILYYSIQLQLFWFFNFECMRIFLIKTQLIAFQFCHMFEMNPGLTYIGKHTALKMNAFSACVNGI